MNEQQKKLIDELLSDCSSPQDILGEGGLLKQLTKAVVERALAAEMDVHLGYEKHDRAGNNSGNSRNGVSTKTLKTDLGDIPLEVPRDRQGTFEPSIVRKGQRRIDGFDDKILALYSRGMSTRDIQQHLQQIYGTEVSTELITRVTDAVLEELQQWQNRPLEELYAIVYLDALWIKVRDHGHVVKKAVYVVIGISWEGTRDVLGLWLQNGEGAGFWMQILTDLQNRGVKDILIACVDGLKGLPEAINAVFPKTLVQTCIVHMIRNSMRHVPWKDRCALAADLKLIYTANNIEHAAQELDRFEKQWPKYPRIAAMWRRNWEHVAPFLAYPKAVRRIIYTTNAIEALNRSIRKVLKTKASFPTDQAAMKLTYLAIMNLVEKSNKGWTAPVLNWQEARNQLSIIFEDRLTAEQKWG